MERITVKCPECGHKMDIDPKVIAFRCSQCGKKIDLDEKSVSDIPEDSRGWQEFNKYNTSKTKRIVDEAKIKASEASVEKSKTFWEHVDRRNAQNRKDEWIKIVIMLLIFIGCIAGLYFMGK